MVPDFDPPFDWEFENSFDKLSLTLTSELTESVVVVSSLNVFVSDSSEETVDEKPDDFSCVFDNDSLTVWLNEDSSVIVCDLERDFSIVLLMLFVNVLLLPFVLASDIDFENDLDAPREMLNELLTDVVNELETDMVQLLVAS